MKRIEKRFPFNFKGEWAKLYVKYEYDGTAQNVVAWSKAAYADIGQDVQYRLVELDTDKRTFPDQPVENAVTKGNYRVIETTDAYFDNNCSEFRCIAEPGDIMFFHNTWWVVERTDGRNVYTPKPQTIYSISLKRIMEEIIEGAV